MTMKRLAALLFFLLHAASYLTAQPAEQSPAIHLDHPREVRRGDILTATILLRDPVRLIRAQLIGADGARLLEVPAFPVSGSRPPQAWALIMGIPSWLEGGVYSLEVYGARGPGEMPEADDGLKVGRLDLPDEARVLLYRGGVNVLAREFPVERVALNSRLTRLRTEETPRRREQTRNLTEILYTVNPRAVYHAGPIVLPLPDTRRSGTFADRRVYEYADGNTSTTIHNGIDFATPEGTPVLASGSGYVVIAHDRELTGLTVVIEHLPGLYSLYYHLSALEVEEGTMVKEGQRIGRVGSTGLATGPHLHWEVRAAGVAVDPEALVRQPIIDKKAIFGMMEQVFGPRP